MTVDEYIAQKVLQDHRETAAALRALLRDAAPDAREALSYAMPVWIGRRIFAYLNGNQKGITFSFVYGTQLADPAGLLKGSGKTARFVRLKSVAQLQAHEAALRDLIQQAVALDAGLTQK